MIEVEGKEYRNLPEQVEENANNIQWLLETIQNFGNVMRYCGSVATYNDLPTEDNKIGDVYNVLDTGNNYAWDGEGWDEISSIVDLSGYVTKINCPLPEYEFNLQNIISTISQYGLENKAIIVKTPTTKMIGYITQLLGQYRVYGYEFRHRGFISFAVQPTSTWSQVVTTSVMATESQIKLYSHRYTGAYVGDETAFTKSMNVGDIIVESTGGQFLINEITFSGSTLTKVVLVGLEDNGNPVVHKFENGGWSSTNYIDDQLATKASINDISFRKMTPSEWLGLSVSERTEQIQKGLIIVGNLTIRGQTIHNPTFLPPAGRVASGWYGVLLCQKTYEVNRFMVYNFTTNIGGFGLPNNNYLAVEKLSTINDIDVDLYYKKPQSSVSLSDGGTITDNALKRLIQNGQPIDLNGFTCYFSCDDGTNYQYVSTRYDAVANKNHINVITIDKTTWVATFHTSDLTLS